MPHTMLRFPTVKARTGLSRSTIYLRISRGTFPAPVSLGGRAVGWIEAEVHAWLTEPPESCKVQQVAECAKPRFQRRFHKPIRRRRACSSS